MDSKKKKVLLIDDDEMVIELVKASLHGSEFEILTALEGERGIEEARKTKPDVILLDIMMPNLDGLTTCNYLKKIPETQNIPIIFLSAKKTEVGQKVAINVGASDYIIKPFDPEDLLIRLRKAVIT
ncbi:MAG: response regulator [Candidatus Latescibacteria bacterium]|jgi:DNA-binding response OmpR family regulator|nr:response regulator [Candidatus Latescibacterota bacterium]